MTRRAPHRLYSLDALRGLAAFVVVFWHWQHFFYREHALAPGFEREHQPLFEVFFLFYRSGLLAVDLFFSLSGFIFFWLYAATIAQHRLSPGKFLVLRFSRLYPLHVLTLLFVAVCQIIYTRLHGSSFVYPYNDTYHFILNLLMVPSVGLEQGFSFNSPAWSISVEVLLYAVFFVFCWHIRARFLYLLGLAVFGLLIVTKLYQPIGRGVGSFFLGGCVYLVFAHVLNSRRRKLLTSSCGVVAAVLWLGTFLFSYLGIALDEGTFTARLASLYPVTVLFPATILALALMETSRGTLGKRLSFLGNISYSSYLWHFPLQLLFVLVLPVLGVSNDFFRSPQALLLFFSALIVISLGSYRYLEMPAQQHIRQRWLAPRPVDDPEPAPVSGVGASTSAGSG